MSQTIVNFLINEGTVAVPDFAVEPRIFDFEISKDAQDFYTAQMTIIRDKLQTINSTSPSPTDLEEISDAINILNNWSKLRLVANGVQTYQINGITVPDPTVSNLDPPTFTSGSTVLTSTMDRNMAESLDKLIRTLRSAGWDPVESPVDGSPVNSALAAAAITKVLDPATKDIFKILGVFEQTPINPRGIVTEEGVIARALSAAAQARLLGDATTGSDSIQQLLMVDYVSRGNELLFNEMDKLRQAIDLNQTALGFLNSLQDLMNQKDPERFILQLQHLNKMSSFSGNPQTNYDNFEEQTYNKALGTVSRITSESPLALQTFLNSAANIPLAFRDQIFQALNSGLDAKTLSGIESLIDPLILAGYTTHQRDLIRSFSGAIATTAGQANIGEPSFIPDMALINSGNIDEVIQGLTDVVNNGFAISPISIPPNSPGNPNYDFIVSVIPTIATRYAFNNRERIILTDMQTTSTTQSQSNPLFQALLSLLNANLSPDSPPPLPIAQQADPNDFGQAIILGELMRQIAEANQAGGIPGLESSDPTQVLNALTKLIENTNLATDTQYLPTWLPKIAERYAALHPATSLDNPLSRGVFEELSSAMGTIGTYSKKQIIDNLDYLINQIVARTGPGGTRLSMALTTIKNDLNNVDIKTWIQDTSAGAEGDKQRHLSEGIVASQSFNDTQREELRRVMFTFEEFYKSATSLLSRITQLIEKMAGAISR